MIVNEIFNSIQGEGKYGGTNVVFLRLSGCDLQCSFCDSQYHVEGKQMSSEEIIEEIKQYNSKIIIITGGEPLLQQQEILSFIKEINPERKYNIVIETNGTIIPSQNLLTWIDHIACSPKLSSSGNDIDKRLNYDALQVINNFHNSIFKFVISTDEDLDEVEFLKDQVPLNLNKIYLMKEGATSKEQYNGIENFIDMCIKRGYHFSPRLHTMIWNNKRKV